MQFFELLKLLLGIFPLVIESVKTIETAFPGLKGSDKLALVVSTVTTASDHAIDIANAAEAVIPAVEKIVETAVSTYNALGIFTSSGTQPNPPVKSAKKA